MSIRHIRFTSRKRAESLTGTPDTAVISITDPGAPEARLHPEFQKVLRLSFFDAVPADEFLPAPLPGLFDHAMARRVSQFVGELQATPDPISVVVHCEFGVSRSAAVALFVEAYSGGELEARNYAWEANQWVLDRLQQLHPDVDVNIPSPGDATERRHAMRN